MSLFGKKEIEPVIDKNGSINGVAFEMEFPDEIDSLNPMEIGTKNISNEIKKAVTTSVSNPVNEVKILPFMLTTDSYTATQIMMLLEMIRYCMEESSNVIDSKDGEAKEFNINLKIRNRANATLIPAIGNESLPAIPYVKDYTIGV